MTPRAQQGDTYHFQRDADGKRNVVISVCFQFKETEYEIILIVHYGNKASLFTFVFFIGWHVWSSAKVNNNARYFFSDSFTLHYGNIVL